MIPPPKKSFRERRSDAGETVSYWLSFPRGWHWQLCCANAIFSPPVFGPRIGYKPSQKSLLAQYLCLIRVSNLNIRKYASGLKPVSAYILNQNPFFKMACNVTGLTFSFQAFVCIRRLPRGNESIFAGFTPLLQCGILLRTLWCLIT